MRLLVLLTLLAGPATAQVGPFPEPGPLPDTLSSPPWGLPTGPLSAGPPPVPDSLLSDDGPPLSVVIDRGGYAVAGPAVGPAAGGAGLWVTAVARHGTDFDPCSGVAERWDGRGAWVPVDTLDCGEGGGVLPPRRGTQETVVNRVHLLPDLLHQFVAASGAGTFRVVYAATDAGGQALSDRARTSPPFALVDFAAAHPEVAAEFGTREGWRALAVGRREADRYVWGHSYGYGSAAAAANRALDECRGQVARAGASARPCWVERVEGPASE